MKTETYSSIYTITDRNNQGDENNQIFYAKRKIQPDYQEILVLKRIDQRQIKNLNYLENLFRLKIANVISPLDIFKNQGKKQNELVVIYQDFVLYKLSQQTISYMQIDTLKKIILQLAIAMFELTRRKIFWPLFSVEQLYLINDCVCISSFDLHLQHYDLIQENFQTFKTFVMTNLVSLHSTLTQVIEGNSFEEIIQNNLYKQGYKAQSDHLMRLPKYHNMLQLFFDMEQGINKTLGFLEPHHFEFQTPDLFQQLYPGSTSQVVYKAIQLDQADREQMLINQEREIQMTELLDGCPQLAVGFCYIRIFDQAFFFMNKYVMTLEQGFQQIHQKQLSIDDNKKMVYRMCWQLSKGLEKMHSQNIMHRNINPANINMDNEDILKANLSIAEFDRSKKSEQKSSSKSLILLPATQANCNSTYSYIPPDDPEKYSIKADLFQFGIVALQIANKGQYFGKGFFGLSVEEYEEQYGKQIIRQKFNEYDERFTECISECLRINPLQRPNTQDLQKTLYSVYLQSKIRIIPKETIIQQF